VRIDLRVFAVSLLRREILTGLGLGLGLGSRSGFRVRFRVRVRVRVRVRIRVKFVLKTRDLLADKYPDCMGDVVVLLGG
jgi:hypothetical protein